MKKVVILTAMDPYKDIRANKIGNSLCNENYDVYVIAGFSDKKFKVETKYKVVDYNVEYNIKDNIIKKILWKLRFFKENYKIIKKIEPNIIHACNVDMLFLAILASKRKITKIVYDSYEICAYKSGVAGTSNVISKIIEFIERFLIKKIDYMICVSNSAKEYFIRKYSIKKIQVITNVPCIKNSDIIKHNINNKFRILYIGNFSINRGIEELIKAGKFINENVEINLQGFGAYEDEFRLCIHNNDLESKVKIIEPILPKDVIKEISNKADVGVVLTKPTSINHKLTVSNKIFDYINAGLPVIMSNVDEHVYLNNKYRIGIIIDEVTSEEIAKAINKLVNDVELYEELSKNCIIASKSLNWNIEKDKLKDIYFNL
ncbi:glycosyltransferase [Clostridium perfringens]